MDDGMQIYSIRRLDRGFCYAYNVHEKRFYKCMIDMNWELHYSPMKEEEVPRHIQEFFRNKCS